MWILKLTELISFFNKTNDESMNKLGKRSVDSDLKSTLKLILSSRDVSLHLWRWDLPLGDPINSLTLPNSTDFETNVSERLIKYCLRLSSQFASIIDLECRMTGGMTTGYYPLRCLSGGGGYHNICQFLLTGLLFKHWQIFQKGVHKGFHKFFSYWDSPWPSPWSCLPVNVIESLVGSLQALKPCLDFKGLLPRT